MPRSQILDLLRLAFHSSYRSHVVCQFSNMANLSWAQCFFSEVKLAAVTAGCPLGDPCSDVTPKARRYLLRATNGGGNLSRLIQPRSHVSKHT